ncbi:hypothetical protein IAI10_23065 [Clostridium sp. 19966]|uniref:hypothetical protein n=1 Tax=Clostridium sp. 19966 TaxID=2768166 RepID=UPI0028DE42A4|nr:hypothetical protein [Clostridium sp. 19966]MDT8719530.1 hypothetical protein [Clostridium sp. 19966]
MNKKHKIIKSILLTTIFTLFFVICLTPVKQSSANPLLALLVKVATADATTTAVVAEKFDMLKDFIKDNGFSTEGMSKEELFNKASGISDNIEDFKPKESIDFGTKIMNDLFGNDNLIFFRSDNGYDFISKPGEDGFGFNDIATEFLANTITDTMESILHPIDDAIRTASNKINETIHPIETLEKQFDFLDGKSNFLDKFDTDKYENKVNENEPSYNAMGEKDWTTDYNLQLELMENKLEIATDFTKKEEEHLDMQENFTLDTLMQQEQQQELQENMQQFQQEQQQQMLDIMIK